MKSTSFFLVIIFLIIACDKDAPIKPKVPDITAQHKNLVESSNSFGLELMKAVHQEEEANKNIIISPLSVSTALSMLLNGTKENTKSQIFDALQVSNQDLEANNQIYRDLIDFLPNVDPLVETSIANSIWYEQSFQVLAEFLEINQTYFDAEVQGLDFVNPSTKDIINNWVANATNQKIESIIDEISSNHVMFLINAVYFNAPWKKTFKENQTSNWNFNLINGSSTSVDMMYSTDIDFGYFQNEQVELINLPYGNEDYHYTILLPKGNVNVNQLVESFTIQQWNKWKANFSKGHGLELRMPKFELDYEIKLNDALMSLGMQDAFSESIADLTGISNQGQLSVSEVKHKTYMRVDEAGTEAAAATSIGIVTTSLPLGVLVDKPFLIIIHEQKTNAILFMGKIMNPKE